MPKQQVIVPEGFEPFDFGIDLILNQSEYESGALHLHFKPRLIATLINPFVLERTGNMMDLLAGQFTEDGKAMSNTDFGKEMDKALGDVSSEAGTLSAGTELNVFGVIGVFSGEHYVANKLGSIENAVVIGTPTFSKTITMIPACECMVDWAVINGSGIMVTDITVQQLVDRFYMERTKGASERRISVY